MFKSRFLVKKMKLSREYAHLCQGYGEKDRSLSKIYEAAFKIARKVLLDPIIIM